MKSIIFRLVLALAALTMVPNALAADSDSDSGNFFLDAKVGETFGGSGTNNSGYLSDSQGTFGLGAGYSWNTDDANSQGFDVGYMDFGTVVPDNPTPFATAQASVTAMMAGVHYEHLYGADKTWVFQARLGLMSAMFDERYSIGGSPPPATAGSDSWSKSGGYFGLGIGRHLNQHLSVILAYDRYDSQDRTGQNGLQFGLNQNWIGLEAEIKF